MIRGCTAQYSRVDTRGTILDTVPPPRAAIACPARRHRTHRAPDAPLVCVEDCPAEAVASFLLSVTSVSTLHYAIAAFAEAVKSTLITLYLAFGVREGARAMTRTGGVDWGSLLLLCAGGGMLLLAVWSIRRAVTRELALSRPSSSRSPKGDCAVRGDGDATRIDRLSLASTMLV